MKRHSGMMVATAMALAGTMILASPAQAQDATYRVVTEWNCTPTMSGLSGIEKLTIKAWPFFDGPPVPAGAGETRFVGASRLNIDGTEGGGAYTVRGITHEYGALINGIHYIALKVGSSVRLLETGDLLKVLETGAYEYFRMIGRFTCNDGVAQRVAIQE
ncbi:hypothetical protein F4212_05515 [Candidatus Poribacteria bacterium]|nr:hypothetical protein [Gammaproteobacteria bacterium]MYF98581.1 hypothetical protein [Candidatus Poribacteria bacterium]